MPTLSSQLLLAMRDRGWTVEHLLAVSKLDCDRSSLNRKLRGKQPISHDEIQALVNALDITVAVAPSKRRRAS